jgi:hypothetical protein
MATLSLQQQGAISFSCNARILPGACPQTTAAASSAAAIQISIVLRRIASSPFV